MRIAASTPLALNQPAHPAGWDDIARDTGFARFQLEGPLASYMSPEGRPDMDYRSSVPQPQLTYIGSSVTQALKAARELARTPYELEYDNADGEHVQQTFAPAIGVLHDAATGYWLTTLTTTYETDDDGQMELPHCIDGPSVGSDEEITSVNVVPELAALQYVVGSTRTIDFTN